MDKIQTIAKSAFNFAKKLYTLSNEYNFQIGEYGNYPISFRFRKDTSNIEVTMQDLDFAFRNPKSISMIDLHKIDESLTSEFKQYYQPLRSLRVNFGEMIEETAYDYETYDDGIVETYDTYFKSYQSTFYDPLIDKKAIPSSWKNVYDNSKIKHNFTIEYDYAYKELIVITNEHYYETTEEIYKLRKTNEYLDEIYTTFYRVFFDKFPKEVVKDCTEFSLKLLKDDYNKLCEHIENVENKSTLTEKAKINLAYYSDYRGKQNHASLYSYMKGYFSLVSQPVSDYTLNVYDVSCKLDIIQTPMNPYVDNGDDLNKYLHKRKLTKTEKRDTFTYFTKIINKYIIPTFEKKDYINDYKIKLDLQINDVNVTDVKHIPELRLLLVYDNDKVIGNINGKIPNKVDTKQLAVNLQNLLNEIRNI